MKEQEFWEIITQSKREEHPIEHIKSTLVRMKCDEILSFYHMLTKQLATAYTFPLLAAHFVIASYTSDDFFREFRAWLICQGREKFERAVNDPESIADWLDKCDVDEIDGEPMLTVGQIAYAEVCGTEDEFFQNVVIVPDPTLSQEWPKTKRDYRNRFPRLVDKFWNQERIREMHTDSN